MAARVVKTFILFCTHPSQMDELDSHLLQIQWSQLLALFKGIL
jgi:hypothetical protein